MDLGITCAVLVGGLGLAGAMVWLERRPRKTMKPRLLPTTPFMFIGLLIFLIAAHHALNLLGVERPQR
jgi:hypothetical protein